MRTALIPILLVFALPSPAGAQHQQLLPSPYPSGNDSARIIVAPRPKHYQYLVPTPYERKLGPNALGNPRTQHVQRHQRRVKTPYPRQYR